jgi:glycerol-3-phosphate O-acyltransferase
VHLAYERCPDGNSLAKQTLGRAKRKESIFRLAKSLKVLVADHGRVFLSFGTPLALTGLQGADEEAAKASTMAVARQVLQRINSQVVVTGPALVAVALIARGRQATVADLTADSARLARYVVGLAAATAWPVILAPDAAAAVTAHRGIVRLAGRPMGRTDQDETTCKRSLDLLGLETSAGVVACPQPLVSARIDWHWGAVGHLLAPLGFVARHLAMGGRLTTGDLHALTATFDQVRQDPTFRLHWPDETPAAAMLAGVTTFLANEGLLSPAAGGGFEPEESPVWQGWSHLVPVGEPGAAEGKAVAIT